MDDASGSQPRGIPRSRTGRTIVLAVLCLVLAGAAALLALARRRPDLELKSDVYAGAWLDAQTGATKPSAAKAREPDEPGAESWEKPEELIRSVLKNHDPQVSLAPLEIDYPKPGSIFPPEIVAPTFLWHDGDNGTTAWLVDVTFEPVPHHIYVVTNGVRRRRAIDVRCVTETNAWHESATQASAKGWTPSDQIWGVMKRHSVDNDAHVTVFGLSATPQDAGARRIVSRATVNIRTSRDPVGALIFYRDVPLMPSETKDGIVKPLKAEAVPLIQWRLRDLSKPYAPVVLEGMPTCANCHSFSMDGGTLAMDVDGPDGDKGAHVILPVSRQMVIRKEDIFTWNTFKAEDFGGKQSFGLFPQISPDGRYSLATVCESVYVQNYMDYRFLQTFYPTRGILAIRSHATGEIRRLPGADDPQYVQGNGTWSPDGKSIVFLHAKARDNYGPGPRSKKANDPEETQIQYDLYRIPFNDGKGGVPEPIPGASNNGMSNSFPKISPDDRWIVFVQCKNGLLQRPDSQLVIIPARGGKARRMNCNMGPMNSWHSWSPNSRWLVFSSKANTPYTEMFLTHIDESGSDSPAILVPNSTAANRAVNLPEFANIRPGGLEEITSPAVKYRRHLEKGKKLAGKRKFKEALAEMQKSLELRADFPATYLALGDLFAQAGQWARAIKHYEKALELEPDDIVLHHNIGACLGQLGRYDEALEHFHKVLERFPEASLTVNIIGVVMERQGKTDEALEYYRRAVEMDPTYVQARTNLADALRAQGKTDEAIAQYRKTAETEPRHDPAYYGWAMALLDVGKVREAVVQLKKVIEVSPNHAYAHYRLALIEATDPDPSLRSGKEAVRHAELACKHTGYREPVFLVVLAAACAEAGRFDDAVRTAERALALAQAAKKDKLAAEIQAHIASFRKRMPLRGANRVHNTP